MKDYCQTKSFRGTPVKIQGNRYLIEIQEVWELIKGQQEIGLSDALLHAADKTSGTIYVHIKGTDISFSTTPLEWRKIARPLRKKTKFVGAKDWFLYMGPIPRSSAPALQTIERDKRLPPVDPTLTPEEQSIKDSYQKYHLYG